VIMALVPCPPGSFLPYVEDSNEDELKANGEQWEGFLRYQIRDVVLCEYHDLLLWSGMPNGVPMQSDEFIVQETKFEKNVGRVKCHLCKLFSEAPYSKWLMGLSFVFQERGTSTGPIERHPVASIYSKIHQMTGHTFRISFPGSEHIRGQKPRIISSTHVDYKLLSGWLNKCRQHHESSHCQPQVKHIPGLKMIDCRTKNVIDISGPGCHYVTLSYVWGDTNASSETPQLYPSTIEDAIKVTVALGLQYLWVDRYVCATTGHPGNNA
jgi:hypothetical protein